MCFCEQNFIKIKDYGKDYGYGRFSVTDESGTRRIVMNEALELVGAFFRERETREGEMKEDGKKA